MNDKDSVMEEDIYGPPIPEPNLKTYTKVLDEIGNDYIENNENWNNLDYIEIQLVEATKKKENEKDPNARENIQAHIGILETQLKALNTKRAQEDAKKRAEARRSNSTVFIMNGNRTMEETTLKYSEDKAIAETNAPTLQSLGKTRKASQQSNINGGTISQQKENMSIKKNTVVNPYGKKTDKSNITVQSSLSAAMKTSYAQASKPSQMETNQMDMDIDTTQYIRIRFQYKNKVGTFWIPFRLLVHFYICEI